MNPGDKLSQLLKENEPTKRGGPGITQLMVAGKLGVHYQHVQKMRKGEISISPQQALILGELFNVSPQQFLTSDEIEILEKVVSGDHRDELRMARAVLESGTSHSTALDQNIRSFYEAVEDKKKLADKSSIPFSTSTSNQQSTDQEGPESCLEKTTELKQEE